MRYSFALVCVFSALFATQPDSATSLATVPHVGCPADGQLGPQSATSGPPHEVNLPKAIADKLAWYEYNGDGGQFGVLAPRGWHCFATIGSDGVSIYVAPEPLNSAKILEHQFNWKGFTGPVVQLSDAIGGTSGRYQVAQMIGRAFPEHRSFIRQIVRVGCGNTSDFPLGQFPTDKLKYKSKEMVEYITPAHRKGLGTLSWLLPNNQPIYGMALLSTKDDWGLTHVTVRLPASQRSLIPFLIQAEERP